MDLYIFGLMLLLIILMIILIMILLLYLNRQNNKINKLLKDVQNEEMSTIKNVINNELNEVQLKMNHSLLDFHTNMTSVIKDDFNRLNENTTNRLNQIENSVNKSLIASFDKTEKIMVSMGEKMIKIDETQKSLRELSLDITSLEGLLKDKKTRGIFGEIELYSLLESAYGIGSSQYQTQYRLSNGTIADAVIFGNKNIGNIVIDSKFPLDNYNRMYDSNLSKEDKNQYRNLFKKDIKKHIDDIANKYLIEGETAKMAYMFIPAEAIFAEIYGHFNEIINYSYEKHVYLVSPTTLMAYITAIKSIYLGYKRDENVAIMQTEFVKLANEFKRFSDRFLKLNKDFEKMYIDFKDISLTSDKITKRFEEIDKVKLDI